MIRTSIDEDAGRFSPRILPGHPLLSIPGFIPHSPRQYPPFQYYFGRDLLVCPVMEPDAASWPVYLPEGQWSSLWTRERFAGGRLIDIPTPLDMIPVFVRQGAELPARLPQGGQLGGRVPFDIQPNTVLSF